MSQDELLRHYQRMGDEEFTYFATHEAFGLTPEALDVLREELRRRGGVPDPDAAIAVQLEGLTSEDFERLIARFREQPCPLCGEAGRPLNAALVAKSRQPETVVGCVPCLEEALRGASTTAGVVAVLRPINSASALETNRAQLDLVRQPDPTPALRRHVWDHRGAWVHLIR